VLKGRKAIGLCLALLVAALLGCVAISQAARGNHGDQPAPRASKLGRQPEQQAAPGHRPRGRQRHHPGHPQRHGRPPGAIRNVVWIWFENHGVSQARNVGEFKTLADSYGDATQFFAHTHPSQPNYVYATAGDTCGITSDALATCSADNIFHQVGDSQWRSYQESMASNCDRTTSGPSPVKHDPARIFTNIDCAANDLPLPANPSFDRKFTFVTPNLCDDGHDCSIQTASDFLASFTPKVLSSPQYKAGNLLYVVTFDEDEFTESNHIYTALVNEASRGKSVSTHYDFCNLLATTEDLLKVGRIGCAVGASSMANAFGLRPG
jgi:phosphatidylinositol-3-phosphatase